jgi:hypothetical protein
MKAMGAALADAKTPEELIVAMTRTIDEHGAENPDPRSPKDMKLIREYEERFPDYFPEGTTDKKKIDCLKRIKFTQNSAKADKIAQSRRLDQEIENREQEDRTGQHLEEIKREADEVYHSGKFPEYIIEEFQNTWYGDSHILKWVICSFATGFCPTVTEGLHLYISGASGLGKSESIKAALALLPKNYSIIGQFSKKGFLYLSESLHPGTMVLIDDHQMQEDEAELYRSFIASWSARGSYYTVDKTTSKELHIPPRITQILTSADGLAALNSDGQNESRFITLEIHRTRSDMLKILGFIKEYRDCRDSRRIEIINAVWQKIIEGNRPVEIPFIDRILIDDAAVYRLREFKKLLSLLKVIAVLRDHEAATEDDFKEACQMWTYVLTMTDNEIPGLARNERILLDKIKELSAGGKRVYLSHLKRELSNMAESVIYRAFYGKGGNFNNTTGGLLTKVRGLSIERYYNKDAGENDRIIDFNSSVPQQFTAPYFLRSENLKK